MQPLSKKIDTIEVEKKLSCQLNVEQTKLVVPYIILKLI